MNPIFGKGKLFGKLGRVVCLHIQRNCSIMHEIKKFCLYHTSKFLFYEENGFKKYSYITLSLSIVLYVYLMSLYFEFCVLHICQKIRKLNMTPFWVKILGKLERVVTLDTLWVKISTKSLYLTRLRRYNQFCACFTR